MNSLTPITPSAKLTKKGFGNNASPRRIDPWWHEQAFRCRVVSVGATEYRYLHGSVTAACAEEVAATGNRLPGERL